MAKYKIIPSSRTIVQSPISIGHKAEKGVEAIEFDLTAWVETYGSGTLTVIMRRWGDAIPYPIALEIDENNKATWTLSDTDTAKAGMAYAQLSYVVGETVVKKSDIYTFRVMDSLVGEGEPPEAYESWLEHLTHLAAEAMAEVLDIESIVTDKTLTVDGGIADAKAVGDEISAVKADLDAIVPGLSNEAKAALLACFDNVAWKDGDGSDYIADLSDALSDDQGYIGSIAFKLSKEGSAKPGGLSISAITNTYQFIYNASGVENRVAIDVSAFAFCAGDIISLDDTDTYAFAIGKDGSGGGDYWIGGGYVSTYPFVATSADIQDMKKMLVKRNDNAVMTSEDLEYILQHITLTRSINKTLANLLVSYDNNPVIAEEDHLAAIRHHLTVTAVYSDMTQENVTLYRIYGRTLRPGANTVKIVYGSKQVSVSVTARVIDHFLLGIVGDSGLGSWGTSAETPEENSGYIAPPSAESDKLTYNISNKTFKAGDVISLGETSVQCAFGTNRTQTSYNNRTWIGGGFLSQNTYTLQSSDISDMKILYVKHRSGSSIDTTSWRNSIVSRTFVQRCS